MKKFNFFRFFTVLLVLAFFSVDFAWGIKKKEKLTSKAASLRTGVARFKTGFRSGVGERYKEKRGDKDKASVGKKVKAGFKGVYGWRKGDEALKAQAEKEVADKEVAAKEAEDEKERKILEEEQEAVKTKTTDEELKESEVRLEKMVDEMDEITKKTTIDKASPEEVARYEKLSKDSDELSEKIRSLKYKKADETGFFKRKITKKKVAAGVGLGVLGGLAGAVATGGGVAQAGSIPGVPLTGLAAGTGIYTAMRPGEGEPVTSDIIEGEEELYSLPEEAEEETVEELIGEEEEIIVEPVEKESIEELLEEE